MRKALLILFLAGLVAAPLFARPAEPNNPVSDYKNQNPYMVKNIGVDGDLPNSSANKSDVPRLGQYPRRDDFDDIEPIGDVAMGDDFLIGFTWYDYQANGSVGKLIARDRFGGVHFAWMKGYDSENRNRHAVYNYLHPPIDDGEGDLLNQPGNEVVVDNAPPPNGKSGYCCLSVLPTWREVPTDNDLGVVYFHSQNYNGAPNADYVATTQSVDFERAFGAFEVSYPPSFPNQMYIWPHGTIDRQNVSHVFACQYWGVDAEEMWQRIAYWRGTVDDRFFEWTWPEAPVIVDTTSVISQVASASPTSDRVVLAWHHNRIGIPTGPWAVRDWGSLYQHNNDICYIVSEDGEEWDWDNDIQSITKIQPVVADLWGIDSLEAYGDTFRPYCDIDIQFDPWGNEELYAVFSATGFWQYPDGWVDADGHPAMGTAEHGFLWFWSSRTDTITMVYDGWYFNRTDQGGLHSRCGGWRMNTDRGSIAFNPDSPGTVYVVWCNFPKIMTDLRDEAGNFIDWEWGEFATDTSGLGYSNAEIMLSVSTDYGVHWQEPYNLTETRWEEADAPDVGECMSENWPSVAYVADDTLHIFYVLDREAGGWPQETGTDATEDPMIYHRVALDDLDPDRGLTALPYAGFMFHNYLDYRPYVLDVVREPSIPVTNNAVVVRAECHAGGEQELELVEIQYSLTENVNDFRTAAMENVGGDNYAGAIPAQAEGTRVWYRIHVANDLDFENYAPAATWWWSYVVRDAGGLTIQDIQETNHIVWNMDQSPYLGYVVTTRGVVTTPASFNQQYGAYAIQNGESSDWAGVFVRGIEDNLEEGQLIEVTGMVMERDPDNSDYWGAATYIDVDSYQVLGNQDVPRPLLVTAGELIWSESAEQLEGVLVEIQDFKIWPTIQAALNVNHFRIGDNTSDSLHAVYFTTNGLTLAVIDDGQLRMGEGFFVETSFTYMMGVFGETLGAYAIAPRKAEDVGEKAVDENGAPSPYFFALDKPYPNPFNAAANIGFELSRSGYTSLVLYDVTGREVATLTEGQMSAGRYTYVLNAASLAAGVYIVRLEAGRRVASQKLVLMK